LIIVDMEGMLVMYNCSIQQGIQVVHLEEEVPGRRGEKEGDAPKAPVKAGNESAVKIRCW
jgi:hypothetical protein